MKKRVLFLCTGNSCRSQMAEGILRNLGEEQYDVFSGGTKPSALNPLAVQVMKEIGIDISGQRSKSVKEFEGQNFDYVITVCDNAKESCPIFPGNAQKIHWSFDDPAEAEGSDEDRLKMFRRVRQEILKILQLFISAQQRP